MSDCYKSRIRSEYINANFLDICYTSHFSWIYWKIERMEMFYEAIGVRKRNVLVVVYTKKLKIVEIERVL